MTPTGNQLERQAPRVDRLDPDMTPPTGVVMPPRAHLAQQAPARPPAQPRARTPQDTLRALEDEPAPVRPRAPGPRPPSKMKLTRRGVGVVVTLSLALVIAMALGIDMLTTSSTPGADGPPPARAVVVTHTVAASVTFDSTGGWLADDHTGTVRHFDTSTGAALGRPVHLGGRPISVVSGFGRIWVADIAGSQVWEINPKTAAVVGPPIAVAEGPVSLAAGRRWGLGGEPRGRHGQPHRSPHRRGAGVGIAARRSRAARHRARRRVGERPDQLPHPGRPQAGRRRRCTGRPSTWARAPSGSGSGTVRCGWRT